MSFVLLTDLHAGTPLLVRVGDIARVSARHTDRARVEADLTDLREQYEKFLAGGDEEGMAGNAIYRTDCATFERNLAGLQRQLDLDHPGSIVHLDDGAQQAVTESVSEVKRRIWEVNI